MKKINLSIALCVVKFIAVCQPYGQIDYMHTWPTELSTGKITSAHSTGFLKAGFRWGNNNWGMLEFCIDKTDVNGAFSGPTEFSREYIVVADQSVDCSATGIQPQFKSLGVTAIETTNSPSGEWYAVTGVANHGCYFATLNSAGAVLSNGWYRWTWPGTNIFGLAFPTKPLIIEEPNPSAGTAEYYITGSYTLYPSPKRFMYVMKVDNSSNLLWSHYYEYDPNANLEPKAMIISPYAAAGQSEVVIVGVANDPANVLTKFDDGFFMRLDGFTGNPVGFSTYQSATAPSNDRFSSIAINNCTSGYIIGGYTDLYAGSGTAWMLRVDQVGNFGGLDWSHVFTPINDPSAGEIVSVAERLNTNFKYEYFGGTTSNVGMMVLKLDDQGHGYPGTNEFVYTGNSGIPTINSISYLDNTSYDVGLHVYGTDNLVSGLGDHYQVLAAFNGASGCPNEILSQFDVFHNGPDIISNPPLSVNTKLDRCIYVDITSTLVTVNPNPLCPLNYNIPPGGSNARATGIIEVNNNDEWSVYPNPIADGSIHIKGLPSSYKVEVLNIIGQQLININNHKSQLDLDFTSFPSGSYNIKITNISGYTKTFKIIKHD